MPFDKFLEDDFKPLKMKDTGFTYRQTSEQVCRKL